MQPPPLLHEAMLLPPRAPIQIKLRLVPSIALLLLSPKNNALWCRFRATTGCAWSLTLTLPSSRLAANGLLVGRV